MLPIGKKDGFTLIEILVVIVIIMVALAMILPNFEAIISSTQRNLLERNLINLFSQAREKAIITNTEQIIEIGENSLRYEVEKDHIFQIKQEIEAIVVDENTDNILTFYPDGSSSGGILLIYLEGDRSLSIRIDPITSKVEIGDK